MLAHSLVVQPSIAQSRCTRWMFDSSSARDVIAAPAAYTRLRARSPRLMQECIYYAYILLLEHSANGPLEQRNSCLACDCHAGSQTPLALRGDHGQTD
jgi:hypothetical protein